MNFCFDEDKPWLTKKAKIYDQAQSIYGQNLQFKALNNFQGIMILFTLILRYRCSMMNKKCFINHYSSFSKLKFIFHLSAIDLHISAIDCMLQIFRSFASVSQCNRFTLLVQSIALTYFLLLTSHAIDLHC